MPPLPTPKTSASTISLTSPSEPHAGDKLTFHWTTDTPGAKNWIGIYDGDRQPGTGTSIVWQYTPGASGDLTLDTSKLSGGPYTAYLLLDDGFDILAESTPFTFTSSGTPAASTVVLTSPSTPHEGDKLTFHWATNRPNAKNWVGIYDGSRPPGTGGSIVWQYTPAASGNVTLDTSGLSGGPYTAYLLFNDGYEILAKTAPFTFAPAPYLPPPHAAVDALTVPVTAGQSFTIPLGKLWFRPQGNPAGTPTYRRTSGDSWLTLSDDGTVTGTAPTTAPANPGRIVVTVRDSAVGTDTVTVQIPVRTPKNDITLKVATLNLWDAGTHTDDALEKQLRVILSQNLDIIALQETGTTAAQNLATALGWNAYQHSTGLGIVSRYPLTDITAPTTALPAAAATIHLPGGRTARLWTAQLDETNYGPYGLLTGQNATQILNTEKQTTRHQQAQALVAAMHTDLTSGTPVILAAGLASPSHLDWTSRTATQHGGIGALQWPVTVALQQAGLTDAYRKANTDPVKAPGNTWSPVRPTNDNGKAEPQDRIDQVQYAGPLKLIEAHTLTTGWPQPVPGTAPNGWPSDHAAAVATFTLPAAN